MSKKAPKHDVITVKLTCHIPVNRDDRMSGEAAYDLADELKEYADELGQTTMESRLNRVPAPAPKSEDAGEDAQPDDGNPEDLDDGMGFPDGLDRRAEAEPAAAE